MIKIRLLDDVSTNNDLVNVFFNHLDKILNDLNLENVTSTTNYYELVNNFMAFDDDSCNYSDLNVSDIVMKNFFVNDLKLILISFPHYIYEYNSKEKMFLISNKNVKIKKIKKM